MLREIQQLFVVKGVLVLPKLCTLCGMILIPGLPVKSQMNKNNVEDDGNVALMQLCLS